MCFFFFVQMCLRHPECRSSQENRDTVFCQMRRAMDLIHYVVKDGVLETDSDQLKMNGHSPPQESQGVFRTRQVRIQIYIHIDCLSHFQFFKYCSA